MARRWILACGAIFASLTAGGCSTPGSITASDQTIALSTLGVADDVEASAGPRTFYLGAGDALGQAVFANYVAFVRANGGTHYAGAETAAD